MRRFAEVKALARVHLIPSEPECEGGGVPSSLVYFGARALCVAVEVAKWGKPGVWRPLIQPNGRATVHRLDQPTPRERVSVGEKKMALHAFRRTESMGEGSALHANTETIGFPSTFPSKERNRRA